MSKNKDKEAAENLMPLEEDLDQASNTKERSEEDEYSSDENSEMINKLEEQKEKFLRLLAEFENYKRRTSKEKIEMLKVAGQDVIKDLLPALDDIDRAEQVMKEAKDVDAVKEGLNLISEKIKNILKSKGLQNIVQIGDDFDTETMEAITEIAAGEKMSGKVVDILEKGYTLNEKIIRYAKVVVGK
ncbi:MAG: nucleotide exchange factor GrpE [Chitinophagales bacterium]|nr:nucleotide exchange factor GrpE [Bacteroidota bacterium]MBP7399101.1 nucleotide exchange factor GrpE [Chitinophagales bacterium]MBK8489043.1 nucleotide exchange factor GrpE [Bacteroidota bacterium]MBK8680892.1 nucleotide exchange factor GrpE [Bacteroidota bacterium]MBP8754536.1 nucleotide exchange factor GrpE [Chitinophagales bacterium]